MAEVPVVLALLPDLMAALRVEAAGQGLGYTVRTVGTLSELRSAMREEAPVAVVVDLAATAFPLAETLTVLRSAVGGAPRVLAFFPHVIKELGRSALAAGYTIVVPRSRFMSDLPGLLRAVVEGNAVPVTETDEDTSG